jgi:hypothetical protein
LFCGAVEPGAAVPVAGAPPPAAGAPSGGAPIVGFDGVTVVPPGESDSPVALVPPVAVGGPVGTFGAPGSDEVGDCASGDGVVNDGTGIEAPTPLTPCAGALPVGAVAALLPVTEVVDAAAVPDGVIALEPPAAAPGAVAVPGVPPSALPDGVPAVVPGAAIDCPGGCICAGTAGSAPICASAAGARPALRQTTTPSTRTVVPMLPTWIARRRRETPWHHFNEPRSRS